MTADELKTAILRTIVREFGDRVVTWEVVEEATGLVNEAVKMASIAEAARK